MSSGLKLLDTKIVSGIKWEYDTRVGHIQTPTQYVEFTIEINGFQISSKAEIMEMFRPKLGKEVPQILNYECFYKGFRDAVSNMDKCTVSIGKVLVRINDRLAGIPDPKESEADPVWDGKYKCRGTISLNDENTIS